MCFTSTFHCAPVIRRQACTFQNNGDFRRVTWYIPTTISSQVLTQYSSSSSKLILRSAVRSVELQSNRRTRIWLSTGAKIFVSPANPRWFCKSTGLLFNVYPRRCLYDIVQSHLEVKYIFQSSVITYSSWAQYCVRTHLHGLVVGRSSQRVTTAIEIASSNNSEWSIPRNRDFLSRSGVLPAFWRCYSCFSCSPSPRPTFNQKSKGPIVRYSVVLIRRNQYLEMPVQMFFFVPFQSAPLPSLPLLV